MALLYRLNIKTETDKKKAMRKRTGGVFGKNDLRHLRRKITPERRQTPQC